MDLRILSNGYYYIIKFLNLFLKQTGYLFSCVSKTVIARLCIIIFSVTGISIVYADSDERYALIIGNSQYQYATKLSNPTNDSGDIKEVLEDLFFDTTLLQNASNSQIKKAVIQFLEKLKSNPDSVGLFYYAGHGVQIKGENYLIAVDSNPNGNTDLSQQSFNISQLLNGMRKAKNSTNIIILDACRDNPFNEKDSGLLTANDSRGLIRKSTSDVSSGLSKLDAPSNTIIAFATAPGRVAQDGKDRNSPYTQKLIESMQRSGININEVFRQVREEVLEMTNGEQIPWETSSLINDFYFKPRVSIPIGF